MASQQTTVDYLVEQMSKAGDVSARKMFGEYGIFCDGTMVALVCDDQLFIKPTPGGRQLVGEITEAPPYEGAKPCFLISGDRWDDSDWLAGVIRATASGLPKPARKRVVK